MRRNIIVAILFLFNTCVTFYGCQPITKQLLAEIYINQGNVWLKQRHFGVINRTVPDSNFDRDIDFNRAVAKFTMALEINPGNAEAHYNRGFCYSILNDPDRACPDFQKACELGDCDGLKWAIKVRFCKNNRYNPNYVKTYASAVKRE